ncbi:CapA family protein [Heliophilum fasciatum]|nr:CapA family protein [Heliophilum fasciatum]
MHNTLIDSGLQPDGTYRFDHLFAPVRAYLEKGDYASVDLESAMAGPATGYTGYPLFNSPDELATAMKQSGFDLVTTANNHILDRGYAGALRTMDALQKAGLDVAGTNRNAQERDSFLIKNIRGVKVGYLAYGYSTNGIPVPKNHPEFYNFLDHGRILADIKALRPQVDVVVLLLHWGVEYAPQPTAEQKKWARDFFEAGADIIFGSHPHVIQPAEIIAVQGKDRYVIYSLGNSVGAQRGLERNSGVIVQVKLEKDSTNGQTTLQEVTYIPTYVHSYQEKGRLMYRMVAVEDAIAQIKNGREPYLTRDDLPTLEQVLAQTRGQLGASYRAAAQ